jgi:outer membrane lipoprotein SlyB
LKTKNRLAFVKPTAAISLMVLSLSGCSSILGEDNDAAACQELAKIVSMENASIDSFSPAAIGQKLRTEIAPLAGVTLATRIEALATALEAPEVDSAAAGAAASEIGVRCALNGVMFDFTGIGQFLN